MVIVVLSSLALVSATITATQTVPSTADQVVVQKCSTLTLSSPITQTGGSGVELLNCNTTWAFTATTGTSTPVFTLSTGYTSLKYLPDDSNSLANCQAGTATTLTSGVPVTFTPNGYDYCATYTNAPSGGLTGFTITWNQ